VQLGAKRGIECMMCSSWSTQAVGVNSRRVKLREPCCGERPLSPAGLVWGSAAPHSSSCLQLLICSDTPLWQFLYAAYDASNIVYPMGSHMRSHHGHREEPAKCVVCASYV
jgi:hypothetical protein